MNAVLVEKGENMESVENEAFRLYGKWQNIVWDGKVTYPRKFGVRDMLHEIDLAINANAAVPSKTFEAAQGRKIAAKVLKDADKATLDKIEAELTVVNDFGGEGAGSS